jgi:hypothetical protein
LTIGWPVTRRNRHLDVGPMTHGVAGLWPRTARRGQHNQVPAGDQCWRITTHTDKTSPDAHAPGPGFRAMRRAPFRVSPLSGINPWRSSQPRHLLSERSRHGRAAALAAWHPCTVNPVHGMHRAPRFPPLTRDRSR